MHIHTHGIKGIPVVRLGFVMRKIFAPVLVWQQVSGL